MVKNNAWNFDTTFSVGDLVYASSTSALSKLNIGSEGQVLTVSGGLPSWQTPSGSTINNMTPFWGEDFIGYQNGWFESSNAASQLTYILDAEHPGTIGLYSPIGSNLYTMLTHGVNGTGDAYLFGGGEYELNCICKIPTLSVAGQVLTIKIGYDTSVSNPTDTTGIWFKYTHTLNSGMWTINTEQSGVQTSANTSSTVDTDWHKYTIIVNSDGTSVSFFIDDVEVTNSPITTNIPVTTGQECGIKFTVQNGTGSNLRGLFIDYVDHQITLTNSRA